MVDTNTMRDANMYVQRRVNHMRIAAPTERPTRERDVAQHGKCGARIYSWRTCSRRPKLSRGARPRGARRGTCEGWLRAHGELAGILILASLQRYHAS